MQKYFRRFPTSQLWLVVLGITLGYLARWVLGAPETDQLPRRAFDKPVVQPQEETIDLPILAPPLQNK